MKLELSKTALNVDDTTDIYSGVLDTSIIYTEYRFRSPMYVESLVLDFSELRSVVGEDFAVGIYYRNSEPVGDHNVMIPLPLLEQRTVTTLPDNKNRCTSVSDELLSSNWKLTAELRTPGWYRIVGVVFIAT